MVKITHFKHEPTHDLAPGAVLFREGVRDGEMFVVVAGELALSVGGQPVETVTAGGIAGEIALVDDAPHSSTATALGPARVVPVDREYFIRLVQEHPTFALQVMQIMAERLRRARGHDVA
jgi:CRP/FNR family transcriptional regulator, cyclic AMP receptor protein